jgi:hypothetical protein
LKRTVLSSKDLFVMEQLQLSKDERTRISNINTFSDSWQTISHPPLLPPPFLTPNTSATNAQMEPHQHYHPYRIDIIGVRRRVSKGVKGSKEWP